MKIKAILGALAATAIFGSFAADSAKACSFAYLIGIQDNTSGSLTRSSILIRLSET